MAYDPTKHLIRVNGGKDYLPVAQRLIWFREAHPDWGIQTEAIALDLERRQAVFRATITNAEGKVMAQATKMETGAGFADYCEEGETGSVGRALALCGFGTQFCAEELDEGQRIVDSPQERRNNGINGNGKPGGCQCAGRAHFPSNKRCPLNGVGVTN